MDILLQDLRFSLRTLMRNPGFALVALLTLALGIGANTAIFSIVNAVLLRPLPYAEPERLVMLFGTYPEFGRTSTSLPDFRDWREQGTVFEQLAAYNPTSSNFAVEGGEPERVPRAITTANFFQTLGIAPAAGRFFLPEEERAEAQRVAVISHRLWQQRLGGSPTALGRTVLIHGNPFTVVGIAPPGFRFGEEVDVWTPLNLDGPQGRRAEFLQVLGRLRPDATLAQAQAQMTAISERLAEAYPQTNATIRSEAALLHEEVVGNLRPALLAFMLAVGLVLLIACANVANLMLTRAAAREREMAVRAALGAGRGRIVRQLLTESVLMALAGAALGLLLAVLGIEALRSSQAELVPRFGEVGVDLRVLGFTLGLAVLTGVLFGLAPALQLRWQALGGALRSGGRGMAGQRGTRQLRGALVLVEVALALMLLIGAGLLLRSFDQLQRIDAGFRPEGVLTANLSLPNAQYPEAPQRLAFFERLLESVRGAPGVEAAALGSNVPLSGGAGYWSFSIEGRPDSEPGTMQDTQPFAVTPEYFRTLQIPLLSGRLFTEQDHADGPRVAIVNETMARRFWPDRNPIGERITYGDPANPETEWMTVVGVVRGTRIEGLTDEPYSQTYVPFAQAGISYATVLLRTTGDPLRLAGTVRQAVQSLDPSIPVYDVKTMEQRTAEAVVQPRVSTLLLGVFAAVALLLAAVGLYGLISYTVTQRTPEIGVRIALGARPADVLRLIVSEGMKPALAGIVVGVFGAWVAARLIRSLLYGVSATDPLTFGAVAAFLAAVALLAAYLPARRATRVDPMVALRSE